MIGLTLLFSIVLTGQIVGVSDGDSITLLDGNKTQHKIRLMGIDAPEKKQAFGNVSKQNLSRLVFGKNVTAECTKVDRYKRHICTIYIDGVDANLQQIEAGLAWHYKDYQREQTQEDRKAYSDAENAARRDSRGLWYDKEPTAPWEFREKLRK